MTIIIINNNITITIVILLWLLVLFVRYGGMYQGMVLVSEDPRSPSSGAVGPASH